MTSPDPINNSTKSAKIQPINGVLVACKLADKDLTETLKSITVRCSRNVLSLSGIAFFYSVETLELSLQRSSFSFLPGPPKEALRG